MVEFYLPIRHVHIAAVLTSATLLFARGLALNLAAARWPLAWPLRYLSWTLDTVLLTAALMLMTITHQDPVRHGWLTVKVLLLVPYIVLGYMALRGATRGKRLAALAGAAVIFGYIYSVARAHDPLGWFA